MIPNKLLSTNKSTKHHAAIALTAMICAVLPGFAKGATVSTGQYDNFRSGSNLQESVLNTSNVKTTTFGKLGAYAVDGEVHAQPLYVPGVNINGSLVNALFVVTMHNSVYAFDTAKIGSAPLWVTTLAPSVAAQFAGTCPAWSTGPELGILSTPVIDLNSRTLYAVYATKTGGKTYGFNIAAIDITTGKQKFRSPNRISASVSGNGYDSVRGTVSLNQITMLQRPALTLNNGVVYVAFASCGPDPDPYHGWLLGYSATNVSTQQSVYNSTPNGKQGGIWQGGRGAALDTNGNLYASTGNGSNSSTDFGNSVLKFSNTGQPSGTWSDPDTALLNQWDLDLSSSGPLYIGSSGLLLVGGKEGVMHVLDPASDLPLRRHRTAPPRFGKIASDRSLLSFRRGGQEVRSRATDATIRADGLP